MNPKRHKQTIPSLKSACACFLYRVWGSRWKRKNLWSLTSPSHHHALLIPDSTSTETLLHPTIIFFPSSSHLPNSTNASYILLSSTQYGRSIITFHFLYFLTFPCLLQNIFRSCKHVCKHRDC